MSGAVACWRADNRLEFVVNLETARALGVTIPQSISAGAEQGLNEASY